MHGHLHKHAARERRALNLLRDTKDIAGDSTLQAKAATLPDDIIAKQIEDGVATIVSVVYVTASATFTGATAGFVTLGLDSTTSADAAAATTQKTTSQDDQPTTTHTTAAVAKTTSTSAQTATTKDATSTVAAVKSTSSEKSSASSSKTSILATSSSVAVSSDVVLSPTSLTTSSASHTSTHSSSKVLSGTAIADTTSTSSSSASATGTASTGMSAGEKGGIAFAVILLLGAVAGLIFFCVRRKKEQQKNKRGLQRLDDEKTAIRRSGTLTPPIAPGVHPRSASPAPRLSVRPGSQFGSNFIGDAEKAVGAAGVGAAMGQRKTNSGADPSNPFGIHAQTVDAHSSDKLAPGTTTLKPYIELPGSPVPSPLKSNPTSPVQERSDPLATQTKPDVSAAAVTPVFSATGTQPGPPANNVHRVQLAFKPSMDDELELRPGDLIRLLHEYDDGWALCIRMDQSKQGVAPRTCLSKLPLKPRPVGPQPNGRMGPPVRPMGAPAQGRRNFSGPAASRDAGSRSMVPAPLSPSMDGRASPATGSPKIQQVARQRARTVSNPAVQPNSRVVSPAPTPSLPVVVDTRPGSKSTDEPAAVPIIPTSSEDVASDSPLVGSVPTRKPVPGQAL